MRRFIFQWIGNYFIVPILVLSYYSATGQLVTKQSSGYGLTSELSGELILAHEYDYIYQLCFDYKAVYSANLNGPCNSPLFVCERAGKSMIYDSYRNNFLGAQYDEVRLYQETKENMYPYPGQYDVNYIDCVLLRKDSLWGYIGHEKSYHFHDELLKEDRFFICEPQYKSLTMITEPPNYDSRKYKRKGRIMVAKRDSLYGALKFENAAEIVPFKYEFPIYRYTEIYDRRGLEFLSTEGGFVPYYKAGNGFEYLPQIIINANRGDVSFEFDYHFDFKIYNEFGKYYLYVVSKDLPATLFSIWDYDTGENIFNTQLVSDGKNVKSKRITDNILKIEENGSEYNTYEVKWYNLESDELILFFADKVRFNFHGEFGLVEKDNIQYVYKDKPSKLVGKLVGSGKEQKIEWLKKPYLPEGINAQK